jgi:hypothetical protein
MGEGREREGRINLLNKREREREREREKEQKTSQQQSKKSHSTFPLWGFQSSISALRYKFDL